MKKATTNLLKALLIVFVLIAGYLGFEVYDYTSKASRLYPKENLRFQCGETITAADIASLESVQSYKMYAVWDDGARDEITVSEDASAITVGEKTGRLTITISATGYVSEHRAVDIPVFIEPKE